MEQQLRDYLDTKFTAMNDKFDAFALMFNKDIDKLKENDVEHYSLDRNHRNTCQANRDLIKKEVDTTIEKFGLRVGQLEGKFARMDEQIVTIKDELREGLKAIRETLDGNKNNLHEWMRTLTPYFLIAIVVVGLFYIKSTGGL